MCNIFFDNNYEDARTNFLVSAKKQNLNLKEYKLLNLKGVQNEELFTDLAVKKGNDNKKAIIIISGTHGIEGFCGSGIQKLIINTVFADQSLNPAIDLFLIHSLNPYGFSYSRRVNENNVDINRNFIDFNQPLPSNEKYKDLHYLFLPDEWMGEDHKFKQKQFFELLEKLGLKELQRIVSLGQYDFPNGIFFGGNTPEWSNITLNKIIKDFLSTYEDVLCIDIHSGLGNFGQIEIIHDTPQNKKGLEITKQWFGDQLKVADDTSASTAINGSIANALIDQNFKNLINLTIEFGTIPILKVFEAICADNWLYANNISSSSNFYKPIKKMIKDAFYCDDIEWKTLVIKNAKIFFQECFKNFEKF